MQLTTFASGFLALAATASATAVIGTVNMFYDPNSNCTGEALPKYGGMTLAIPPDYINTCQLIPGGVGNTTYKRFSAVGINPNFYFELYNDTKCTELATKEWNVCVSNIKSYITRRTYGN